MSYLVFLGGIVFGVIFTRILMGLLSGSGFFSIIPYRKDDGFYKVSVSLKKDEKQRYIPGNKSTYWTDIDPWLVDALYLHSGFEKFFDERSGKCSSDGLYPTVTIRQIMWALKMKPLKRERWETCFDRRNI